MPKQDKQKKQEPLVIDAADERPHGVQLARVALALILCALAAGFVVGFASIGILRAVDLLQEVVWDGIAEAFPEPLRTLSPVLLCVIGGLLIGLATKRAGSSIDTLADVIVQCQQNGGYFIRNVPWTIVLFALPIAFGGAVGPEAGISGFIAALATNRIIALRRSGVAAVTDPSHPLAAALGEIIPSHPKGAHDQDVGEAGRRFSRRATALLWAAGAVGFVFGAMALGRLFGPGSGLPRLDPIDYLHSSWPVGLLAFVCGYLFAQLAHASLRFAKSTFGRLGTVGRAVACGVVLGAFAVFLPDVLFSGQHATSDLAADWQTRSAAVLLATCAAKLFLTQACVESGWVGGEFFPLIFCGVSIGYALALIFGVDPMLPVAVACGALLSAVNGKPLVNTLVLALCLPVTSLPIVAVAAFAAAKIPGLGSHAAKEGSK